MAQQRFSGLIPPMITPMTGRDRLDLVGLGRLVEHLISGGVHGLFTLGTTGEAPSLSHRLQEELVSRTVELAANRVPVLVGITDTSFVESVRLAEHAAKSGAKGLVLSTPYYFPAGQTELKYYVDQLIPELPLPVMLYNIPSLTKVWFEIQTLEELTVHPSVVGLKDSSGDLDYFQRAVGLKKLRPDWSIMIGPEALLARSLELGGDGGVAGGANLYPNLFVKLYELVRAGDPSWHGLQSQIEGLQGIYDIGKYASRFIKGTKCGASLLGICDDFMADPFHRFRAQDRQRVRDILCQVEASRVGWQLGCSVSPEQNGSLDRSDAARKSG
ncbi:MAG: dihydrodipicolinate synthase family protein [Planctomycetes bacterium]|nr:dihydrodipicolinate synthase family protein [Planctomycetota bacterium]